MLKIIRITFYIVLPLFILDALDLFQTKIAFLKAIIYYGILILPIPLLLMEFLTHQNLSKQILRKTLPILTIIGLIYLGPISILFNKATWKTQTVLWINNNRSNHKVEFQMKDIGALGYSKRNLEVYYLTDYFYIVLSEKYDPRNFLGTEWKKVDQKFNEMGFK